MEETYKIIKFNNNNLEIDVKIYNIIIYISSVAYYAIELIF